MKTVEIPTEDMVSAVSGLPFVESASRSGSDIAVRYTGEKTDEVGLFNKLAQLNIGVYSISESDNALENRYLELIKESR